MLGFNIGTLNDQYWFTNRTLWTHIGEWHGHGCILYSCFVLLISLGSAKTGCSMVDSGWNCSQKTGRLFRILMLPRYVQTANVFWKNQSDRKSMGQSWITEKHKNPILCIHINTDIYHHLSNFDPWIIMDPWDFPRNNWDGRDPLHSWSQTGPTNVDHKIPNLSSYCNIL